MLAAAATAAVAATRAAGIAVVNRTSDRAACSLGNRVQGSLRAAITVSTGAALRNLGDVRRTPLLGSLVGGKSWIVTALGHLRGRARLLSHASLCWFANRRRTVIHGCGRSHPAVLGLGRACGQSQPNRHDECCFHPRDSFRVRAERRGAASRIGLAGADISVVSWLPNGIPIATARLGCLAFSSPIDDDAIEFQDLIRGCEFSLKARTDSRAKRPTPPPGLPDATSPKPAQNRIPEENRAAAHNPHPSRRHMTAQAARSCGAHIASAGISESSAP